MAEQTYKLWLCDLTHTRQMIALNNIPMAIGMIASTINKKFPGKFEIKLFKYPEDLIENALRGLPQIIGFSNYVWNLHLGCEIAKKIKSLSASTITIFGGPNFPWNTKQRKEFLSKRQMIDFYVYGEAEEPVCRLLNALILNKFNIEKTKSVPHSNCCALYKNRLVIGDTLPRETTADVSPYLDGLLEPFFTEKTMPMVETARGCPYSCTFCNGGNHYYDKIIFRKRELIKDELFYIVKRKKSQTLNIADCDFGMHLQDIEVCKIIRELQDNYGWPKYIYVAIGKEKRDRILEAARLVKGAIRFAAAVQSMDDTVLKNIKRHNIPPTELIEIVKKGNAIGCNTATEVILGLPGDTKEKHFKSIEFLVDARFNYIRSYSLIILKGTELDSEKERKKWGIQTKFRVSQRCFGAYQFGDAPIYSLETEEICYATKTLSFQDYLDCRKFTLILELVYNDSILGELLTFLKNTGISPYTLLKEFYDYKLPPNLSKLFSSFRKETENELWDSEDELYKFASSNEVMDKYISGEYGSNIVMKYKTLGFIKHLKEIHDVAFDIAIKLKPEYKDFLSELKTYSILSKQDFFDTDSSYSDTFHYDVKQLNPIKLKKPATLHFEHSAEQKEIIKNALKEFGSDTIGIMRIFVRIHVSKIYRQSFQK
jgi:radical SAM superfamily enzyme YgiQ (UPF0313 family)